MTLANPAYAHSSQREGLRVHFFQHIRGEGLGSLGAWCERHQATVTVTEFFEWHTGQELPRLPAIEAVDLLVIMGGAMSVNDEIPYPWLVAEKQWIREFIALKKPVIGLCLGGQLIANALGAPVTRNPVKEIGWWPIERVTLPEASLQSSQDSAHPKDIWSIPEHFLALSWHGDTFALPEGAVLLARSKACAHQIFQSGTTVIGFQCHPESTPHGLQTFLDDEGYQELAESGPYVQTAAQLEATQPEDFERANGLLEEAVEFVLTHAYSNRA